MKPSTKNTPFKPLISLLRNQNKIKKYLKKNKINYSCNSLYVDDFILTDPIQKLIKPLFDEWYKVVNDLLKNHVYDIPENIDYDSCTDFVFFKRYRITKTENELKPKLYILNDQNWVQVQPSDRMWPLNFQIQNNLFYNQNVFRDETVLKIVSAIALSEILGNQKILQKDMIHPYFSFYTYNDALDEEDEITIIRTLSKLFIRIVSNKFKLEGGRRTNSIPNPFYIKPFVLGHNLKKIRRVISKCLDKQICKYCLIKNDNMNLESYCEFVNQYRGCLDALNDWLIENPVKLVYLLRSNTKPQKINDRSFFSFSNLASIENPKPYSFLDKSSLKKTLLSNRTIMKGVFSTAEFVPKRFAENNFKFWTYWLGHTSVKKINSFVFLGLKTISIYQKFNRKNPQHLESLPKMVTALDLLYELLLNIWNLNPSKYHFLHNMHRYSKLSELMDYLFFINDDEQDRQAVEFFRFANVEALTKKTTLQRLEQRSHQWHIEIQKRRDYEEYNYLFMAKEDIQVNSTVFTPIVSNEELVAEGSRMHHCISIFHKQIKAKEYIAFKVRTANEIATLGIDVYYYENTPQFEYDQCYRACNEPISRSLKRDVDQFINKINFKPSLVITDYCNS